jgi:polysaccharide pyruvyl transferase WcaK-like protein
MIQMYYHAGSENHGCEAIVRSTNKILSQPLRLFSMEPESDRKYGIGEIVALEEDRYDPPYDRKWERLAAAVHHKLTGTDYLFTKFARKAFSSQIRSGDVHLSIGGDNYCYGGNDILSYYNRMIHEKGAKTVLWGCSFEPKDMTDSVAKDLAQYDLITARESISYEVLKKVNPNTVLVADPAFQLDKVELPLPEGFVAGNTVGINVSPLIMKSEQSQGITKKNYENLIKYILTATDMHIALIPHVVKADTDDREPLLELYEQFRDSGRVVLIDDHNCMELKGFISRCRFFVGARTHATIAAYSTCVPTLVVGYSVKARGIARDIFGSEEHYVLPVQSLREEEDLTNGFRWLEEREDQVREHLSSMMPAYKEKVYIAKETLHSLI